MKIEKHLTIFNNYFPRLRKRALYFAVVFAIVSCFGGEPEKIYFGKDSCQHCKMILTDKRFGAEIVSKKGKTYKFDAIECMQDFEKENKDTLGTDYRKYIVNSVQKDNLVPIEKVFIYEDPQLRSPMGKGYLTADSESELLKLVGEGNKSKIMKWSDLLIKIGK